MRERGKERGGREGREGEKELEKQLSQSLDLLQLECNRAHTHRNQPIPIN